MLRQLAVNNLVLIIQYAVGGAAALLLVPHIVRTIGLESYGKIAIALAFANYGNVVVQYAFQLNGPRLLAQLRPGEHEKDVVCRVASAKITLLAGVLVTLLVGGLALHSKISTRQLFVLVALPLGAALNTGYHLQTKGLFAWVSGISIFGTMISLTIGFSLVRSADPAADLAATVALGLGPLVAGVGTSLASSWHLRRSEQRIGWRPPWALLREGWPLFASQFTATLYGASGPIVIGAIAGAAQAGAYSAVERVTNAIVGACLLTHTAAYPRLAGLYLSDRAAYWRLLRLVVAAYIGVTSVVACGAAIFWQQVQHFLFGSRIVGQGPLILAGIAWLLIAVFGTVVTGYLTVSGRGSRVLPLTLKILALSFVLGVPGVMLWGGWAWLGALVIAQGVNVAAFLEAFRSRSVDERGRA
jgi:O-antigen/teichoic acid export membrane protein